MAFLQKRLLERPFTLPLGGAIICLLMFVGAVGLQMDLLKSYLIPLTPVTLLLTAIILFSAHASKMLPKEFGYWFFVYTFGFLIEMLGTNSGWPFGSYEYSEVLGPAIFNTPFLIGLNWLSLLYCFNYGFFNLGINRYWIPLLTALSMTLFDFFIEPVAIDLNFWQWANNEIPINNYIAWFAVALLLSIPFIWIAKPQKNPILPWYFGATFGFFLLQFVIILIKTKP